MNTETYSDPRTMTARQVWKHCWSAIRSNRVPALRVPLSDPEGHERKMRIPGAAVQAIEARSGAEYDSKKLEEDARDAAAGLYSCLAYARYDCRIERW